MQKLAPSTTELVTITRKTSDENPAWTLAECLEHAMTLFLIRNGSEKEYVLLDALAELAVPTISAMQQS